MAWKPFWHSIEVDLTTGKRTVELDAVSAYPRRITRTMRRPHRLHRPDFSVKERHRHRAAPIGFQATCMLAFMYVAGLR